MKIRNGYVSNSSSSSFIISDEFFPTVKDLAKYMIKQMEYYPQEILDKLNNINIDADTPLSFPSCNYDTYIKKVGDCYLVATCNNEYWELGNYHTQLTNLTKNELLKLQKQFKQGGEDYENISDIISGDYDVMPIGIDYYNLQHDIVGIEEYETCPNCNNYTMWKTQKYGQICLNCSPILKRTEKLKIINNISNENTYRICKQFII